jgi:hypothetical protein
MGYLSHQVTHSLFLVEGGDNHEHLATRLHRHAVTMTWILPDPGQAVLLRRRWTASWP